MPLSQKSWSLLAKNSSNRFSLSSLDDNFLSFAVQEKCSNSLMPGLGYMMDALKLPNQVPKVSGKSVQMCIAWCCPYGTLHVWCWPNLGVFGQLQALNILVVDSRDPNFMFGHMKATHNKLFHSSTIKCMAKSFLEINPGLAII